MQRRRQTSTPRTGRHRGTHRRAPRALAALAATAVLCAACAVALSGCGASATLDPIARAADVSEHQAGARIVMTMQLSAAQIPGGSAKIVARGFIDERAHAGELTMDLAGIPGASAAGASGTMQMIFDYPTFYMRMPALAGRLPEGRTWMKFDIVKALKGSGISIPLSSASPSDPTELLRYLRASSGGVTNLGAQTLAGVATTHYRGTLELGDVLAKLPADQQAAARATLEKLGESGAIPVEVWVDRQDRVRRMQLGISAGGASSGLPSVSAALTVDFTSYGPVPAIAPPPASEVFDATAMAQAGLAHAGVGAGG
jgi:hypothetical protein